jgi:hypothetical protein
MKKIWSVGIALALLAGSNRSLRAAEQNGQQRKEEAWLERFVGEWEAESSGTKVSEAARMMGPWMIDEIKIDIKNGPMHGMLTLGYEPQRKKYVGTWIDSKTRFLWVYEGTVDPSGKVLTLETEGPNPMVPGKLFKARDVHSFTDQDHRTLTSSMLGEDGKWHTFQNLKCQRTK